MATAFTNCDQLAFYPTTAGGSSATGRQAESLGGMRWPVQIRQIEALISGDINNVIVEEVGGYGGAGTCTISVNESGDLSFAGQDGTFGSAVTVVDGAVALLEGSSANYYCRVRRDGSDDMAQGMGLDVLKTFNNVIGMGNLSTTASAAGQSDYRGLNLVNEGSTDLTNIYLLIATLGTQRTTGTAQLGASGSGTITTATASGFADWPSQGWARIKTSGGTLREIVYYTSRTATSLTVPSAGRARLGTTAAAGSATDTVDAVPGLRIGLEALGSEGTIQTVASATTAPTGVTWYTGTTTATAATIASLTAGNGYGVWLHREIPAGATGTTQQENRFEIQWSTYSQKYYGLYRVAQASLEKYELFQGVDAFPSFTSAVTSSTSLPFLYGLSLPGTGTRAHRLVCRYTDTYGVKSYNTAPHNFTVNSSGTQVGTDVSTPYDVALTETASGYVTLTARYTAGVDSSDADTFRYYVTTSGVDPTTGGTPVDVTMSVGNGLGSWRTLSATLGPYDYGTDLRVLVTAYRTSDSKQSLGAAVEQVTISTVAPAPVAQPAGGYSESNGIDVGARLSSSVTYLNAPTNTVYLKSTPGATELWSSTTLVFRCLRLADGTVATFIPSTWALNNTTISGTGTATAFEVVSANEIYICVAGTRRLKIDVKIGRAHV